MPTHTRGRTATVPEAVSVERDPRGLRAAVCTGAAIGTAVPWVSPLIVGALIAGGGFAESGAGLVLTVEILAGSATALLAGPRLGGASNRRLALAGVLLAAAGHAISAASTSLALLGLVRFVAGIGAGLVLAVVTAAAASSVNPARLYGFSTVFQSLNAAALFAAMPLAIGPFQQRGAFGVLLVMALLYLPFVSRLPARALEGAQARLGRPGRGIVVLASFALLQAGNGAWWAFAERLGSIAGLETETIGLVLAVNVFAAFAGGALASAIGQRFGSLGPLVAGALANALAVLLTATTRDPTVYTVAMILQGPAYNFMMVYQLALAAGLDRLGRWAAMAGGTMGLGFGAGPAIGGVLVQWTSYAATGWFSLACTLVALVVLSAAARRGIQGEPLREPAATVAASEER